MKKINLLIIDPQNDFILDDAPLHVAGAQDDMKRLASFVNKHGDSLNEIRVTLDSHHPLHIAHPIFWVNENGDHPKPFTIISHQDVLDKVWMTTSDEHRKWSYTYTKALGQMCIWPPHCLIGSSGHNVVAELFDVLRAWEEKDGKVVEYITKGSNIWTEHFGAVEPEVPLPEGNQTNRELIRSVANSDITLVAGEASSHCVAKTVGGLIKYLEQSDIQKMVILPDVMSPVTGFENLHDDFFNRVHNLNMEITSTEKASSLF